MELESKTFNSADTVIKRAEKRGITTVRKKGVLAGSQNTMKVWITELKGAQGS